MAFRRVCSGLVSEQNFSSMSFHMPESIADLEIDSGLVIGQPPQFVLEVWKGPSSVWEPGASFVHTRYKYLNHPAIYKIKPLSSGHEA
eukprot:1160715-Pelagomonas_calceolata.AAC.2